MNGSVAIVGGGIGGLTAAIALRQRGIDAHVYESAPVLEPVGAGITVPPNAMRVLERLGVAERVLAAGLPVERGEIWDARSGLLQGLGLADAWRRVGAPMVAIHRHRLHEVLTGALPAETLHLGAACEGVEAADGGALVRLAVGRTVRAEVVVGADGLRSVVRRHVAPGARLRYSGQTSWRGVARFAPAGPDGPVSREIWGAGRRFGHVPIGPDEVYWFATLDAPAGRADPTGGPPLAGLFAAFPRPVPELLDATDPGRVVRTDMYDLAPLRPWSRGRVALLGDAAHTTTPNLGQGAAQAIEDAWVLAERLATDASVQEALRAYEAIRAPRARLVVERSRRLGRIAHLANPLVRALRNAVVRHTPPAATLRRMEEMYTRDEL